MPFDGWYVRGDFALDTLRFQAYYFCNDAGVIHNQWPERSGTGMVLCLNPDTDYSHDSGFVDLATMMVHICCLAISQENEKTEAETPKKTD